MNRDEEEHREEQDSLSLGFEVELAAQSSDSREGGLDYVEILATVRTYLRRPENEAGTPDLARDRRSHPENDGCNKGEDR